LRFFAFYSSHHRGLKVHPILCTDDNRIAPYSFQIIIDKSPRKLRNRRIPNGTYGGVGGGSGLLGNYRKEKRYRGYQYAMEEAGLPIDENWVIDAQWDVALSYELTKQAFESNKSRPTAIFAASDMLAIAAMRATTERDLKIPDDMAFFAVDNIELSQFTSPPLSTIHVPKLDMGMIAAKLLLDYLKGYYSIPVKLLVPHKLMLMLRQSTGASQR
jgi:LacI family transcriptional regulator